jgi:8-oxo-dGTP diphosphatase
MDRHRVILELSHSESEKNMDGYDPRAFDPIAVTVDVVALTIRDAALHVLLIRRGEEPYLGQWALPGGFVKTHHDGRGHTEQEGLEDAAARELAEETGLHAAGEDGVPPRFHLEQLATYGDPERDPRMRVVSVAFLAFGPELPIPQAGTDAAEAEWVAVHTLGLPGAAGASAGAVTQRKGTTRRLAFDHARILADGLERARSKLEYTPLAAGFLDEEFTISELRSVYETVWGEQLHAGNFHRKVLSVPGFVDSIGTTTERGGRRGGPRSRLYRAGDATLLHPALLRPAREDAVR